MEQSDGTTQRAAMRDLITEAAREADLRLVRFLYNDLAGITRGKAAHAAGLADRLVEGVGLSKAYLALNGLDQVQPVSGLTPVGEVRLAPDLTSFTVIPYAPRTAAVFCDVLSLDRTPFAVCPRDVLRRATEQAEARDLSVEAVFEAEFYLARTFNDGIGTRVEPLDRTPSYSTAAMQSTAAVMDDILGALEGQHIQVEQVVPEAGPGQHELTVRHAPAMRAADTHLLVRETIRAIAVDHEMTATFAPQPFAGLPGSGAHVHLSLWDTRSGENRLYDPAQPGGFSQDGRRFIAGVLAHLPGLLAITCPTVNSYRRLRPRTWTGATAGWGFDHREASVRVPSPYWGREQGTTNIEIRTVDGTCNPYLALGAIIAAGLDGLDRELDPGDVLDGGHWDEHGKGQTSSGLEALPQRLDDALDALEADAVLTHALGTDLLAAFLAVRRSEAVHYRAHDDEVECQDHMLRY